MKKQNDKSIKIKFFTPTTHSLEALYKLNFTTMYNICK